MTGGPRATLLCLSARYCILYARTHVFLSLSALVAGAAAAGHSLLVRAAIERRDEEEVGQEAGSSSDEAPQPAKRRRPARAAVRGVGTGRGAGVWDCLWVGCGAWARGARKALLVLTGAPSARSF